MGESLAILLVLLVAGGALLALLHWLAHVDQRRAEMSEEEYEENRAREAGLLGNGLTALDGILRPQVKQAIEYRRDAKQGQLPGAKQDGERLIDPENP